MSPEARVFPRGLGFRPALGSRPWALGGQSALAAVSLDITALSREPGLPNLLTDLRIALRGFRRTPVVAISAILILGLAIGMATAIASVVRAVLLQRLPVRDQERIAVMWTYQTPGVEFGVSNADLDRLRAANPHLSQIAGVVHWGSAQFPMVDGSRSLLLARSIVTGNYFDVLGVRPFLGRMLHPDDDRVGAPQVLVLGYRTWREKFGGDSTIVGRRLIEPYEQTSITVVGVAPPGLDYPNGVDFWLPMTDNQRQAIITVARLSPATTLAQARNEFLASAQRLHPEFRLTGIVARPLAIAVSGNARAVLLLLAAAVLLLLVVACVNVGNLLLLRAASRARELFIRRALGASFTDIARQLLVESTVLAAAGGAVGVVAAWLLLRLLIAEAPAQLPRLDVIQLDGVPLVIAVMVSGAAVLMFGVVPAMLAAGGAMSPPAGMGMRNRTQTRHGRRLRQSLVACQVAIAVIMLAGAGLLARSLARFDRLDLGYRADHLSIMVFSWPVSDYLAMPQRLQLGREVESRWRTVPGVVEVTPIVIPPFLGENVFVGRLGLEGHPPGDPDAAAMIPLEIADDGYWKTFGVPLRRGRTILASDDKGAAPVAVVSESVARRFWPNEDPIGKRIRYVSADTLEWRTVVGVSGDIRFRNLRNASPTIFIPWQQSDAWQGEFAIRTTLPLPAMLPVLRRELQAVDPRLALWSAKSMDELLSGPLAQPRLSAFLMSAFGLVALLLASIGLYALMAAVVREQTREIGIRAALGATGTRLRREVLLAALRIAVVGAAVGVAGALAGSRLLGSLLFEVSPGDLVSVGGAAGILLAVTLAAAYLPARRATRIDPVEALRNE
jgi:putative ABC transport system permease protein